MEDDNSTIELDPDQAVRMLAVQLAANVLKAARSTSPFGATMVSAQEIVTLATFILDGADEQDDVTVLNRTRVAAPGWEQMPEE